MRLSGNSSAVDLLSRVNMHLGNGSTTDLFVALYVQICYVIQYTVRALTDFSAVGD